jgi:hypothetical protein
MLEPVPVDFDTFNYTPPPHPADYYAEQAVAVLQAIEHVDRSLLPYVLPADIVLTLSGVRAHDTHIAFGAKTPEAAIRKLQNTLGGYSLTLFPNRSEYQEVNEDQTVYYLVHHVALNEIPELYHLPCWITPHTPFTLDRWLSWSYIIESQIYAAIKKGQLPKAWANVNHVAHHIRYGVLLGYPGEAIASFCWHYAKAGKRFIDMPEAEIEFATHYHAATPTYAYHASLAKDQNIRAHSALWSDILRLVYESPWHTKLQKSRTFKRVLAAAEAEVQGG